MKDILITIFDIKDNIYLAYWLNVIDARFETVNFAELVHQEEATIPFLNDTEKLRYIFPDYEGDIFVGLIRNDDHSVIIFSKDKSYIPLNKNIFDILQKGSLRDAKNDIESYLEEIFSDTVDPDIQNFLAEMHKELINYSSFVSVYDFESDKLIASTLPKKKDENFLAREVYLELKRHDLIKKIELEVNLKKIGSNVQVFYFYTKGLIFCIYCINVQVNTGIIRLKLKAFLKNKSRYIHYISNNTNQTNSIIRFASPDYSDKKTHYLKFTINFNNY